MSFRQYRKIEPREFIIVAADCSQGGADYNACVFLSKSKLDVPLVYHTRGVAASMTSAIHPILEHIFDTTGIKPIVCFERNNGGASEMERLAVLNRQGKYQLYRDRAFGMTTEHQSQRYGWTTNTATRPQMLGDLKNAIDSHSFAIYDKIMVNELYSFIVNDQGKPEAELNSHDDMIFAMAIAWQLYQTAKQPITTRQATRILQELPREAWRDKKFY